MPKLSIGDINLYYRVFRDKKEYRCINEETTIANYFYDENNNYINTDIPLKSAENIEIKHEILGNCVDIHVPTLLVLPGGPGFVDHSLYIDFWSSLSDVIQIIVLDQRGNGRSDRGRVSEWNLETCASDVKKFSERLNLMNPPIVAGISWGGYVAMLYAIKFPAHPKALVLMHTEAKVESRMRQEAFAARAREHGLNNDAILDVIKAVSDYDHLPADPGVKENYMQKCWGTFYGKNPYQPKDFVYCVVNMPMRIKFAMEENLKFDFLPQLSRIICPVLYIAGEIDPGHPLQGAQEAAKLIKNIEFQTLVGLGAPVYRDDPDLTREIVVNFINKHI